MTGRAASAPRWPLVFLVPAVVVSLWIVGGPLGDIALLFVVSVVIALLLNPLVRLLHLPRPLAVIILVLALVAAVVGIIFLILGPARDQLSEIRRNIPAYSAQAQERARDLQDWLGRHGIHVDLVTRTARAIPDLREALSHQTGRIVDYGLSALRGLLAVVVIVVSSVYLLLDARRIGRAAERVVPGAAGFLRSAERRLGRYLRAQILVSAIIGVTVGTTMWIYGVTGLFEDGSQYALAFGVWAFFMEFVPYVGPVLEAIPPLIIALFTQGFTSALWVIIAFVVIQQLEGHIIIPRIMGNAAGVHPLVVIFGLLLGEALLGPIGVVLALPLLVIVREATVFAWDRAHAGPVPPAAAPAAPLRAPPPSQTRSIPPPPT